MLFDDLVGGSLSVISFDNSSLSKIPFDYSPKGGNGPLFIPLPSAFSALANSGTICHLFRNWQLRQC